MEITLLTKMLVDILELTILVVVVEAEAEAISLRKTNMSILWKNGHKFKNAIIDLICPLQGLVLHRML